MGNTFTDGVAATAAGAVTVGEAIEIVKVATGRHGGYDDAGLLTGISACLDDLTRRTRIRETYGTVALGSAATTVDLSGLTDFRPERFRAAYINNEPVQHIDIHRMHQIYVGTAGGSTGTARPTNIAFQSATIGMLSHTPGTAYSEMEVHWRQPFAAMSTTATAAVIDLATEYLRPALWKGPAYYLRIENEEAGPSFPQLKQDWDDFVLNLAGDMGFDSGVIEYDEDDTL